MKIASGRTGYVQVGLIGLFLAGISSGVWLFVIQGHGDRTIAAKTPAETSDVLSKAISVKTTRPRRDTHFQMTVERPADVEAYYRADIEAQVAGEVKWIRVAPGSRVEKDQILVRVHVPDKWALVKEKQNIITQREREFDLTQEKRNAAEEAVKTALANVELKRSLLLEAKAETRLREIKLQNLDQLLQTNSIQKIYRDEGFRSLEVAREAEKGADAIRIKAEQEVEDARANVKVMAAEGNRAKQLIEVAKSDHEQAAAIAEYAVVKAPFPGAVVRRLVDPGSFVQNASTGHATPMLTLERSDIVTVVMHVPDNYATYISSGTEANIELDAMPGLKILGKVTRFSPSLVTAAHDRTMRVEVDLWNEAPEKYRPFFADAKNLADLKEGPLPILPEFKGKANSPPSSHLITGMYGKMTLILKSFGQIELIPSQAIIRQGGRTSIYVVQDGKAYLLPVEVQVDDGIMAHVVMLGKNGENAGHLAESEQVIISNQEELSEGQPVNPVPHENGVAATSPHPSH
ncbi:MAG TPA: efflux RND transporter periplasmic adaptor subunit [Gemmata sp.]|jgi:multidrug resistance efflux pump|nr:efflux RND transporter periplasmic adaptor subunit [Gemmata sp.]